VSVTYPLRHPVELRTAAGELRETVAELTFDRLQGAQARKVLNARDKGSGEFIAALVCASARIPPSTYDLLDAADISACAEIASDFFGSAPPTSST
jgi:hypothetical protein